MNVLGVAVVFWRQYLSVEVRAVIVGALLAFGTTWLSEWWRAQRRRKDVASALVCELRHYERRMKLLCDSTTTSTVVFTRGFPDDLLRFSTPELAHMGPRAFLPVAMAYAQCSQVDYLRTAAENKQANVNDPSWGSAYLKAVRDAADRIRSAMEALRPHASHQAYDIDLPQVGFTKEEMAAMGKLQ